MFSLPSSRRLVTPALLFFIIVASIRLYLRLTDLLKIDIFHHIIIESSARSSHNFALEAVLSPSVSLQDHFLEQYHSSAEDLPSNPHVARVLSRCARKPNRHTGHIRLPNTPVLNMSMIPPATEANADEFKNNQYFNPAILPLPSYISSSSSTPYQYLLISRLVTSGTHQESHICFANICAPFGSSAYSPTCSDEDISLLGPAGGMKCMTKPAKVNIPPTPAKICTGAWKVFPDIPGFHDPRVFWSGRGEPLIEVNSGSAYGCIGLWMQDLREVFGPLKKAFERKGHSKQEMDGEKKQSTHAEMDFNSLGTRIGYPKLTELTKNPRESRADVEKNWIVFFPSEDEMWVQYNAMGKSFKAGGQNGQDTDENGDTVELSPSQVKEHITSSVTESPAAMDLDDIFEDIGLPKLLLYNHSIPQEELTEQQNQIPTSDVDLLARSNTSTIPSHITTTHKILPRNISDPISSTEFELTTPRDPSPNPPPQPQPKSHLTFSSGRTLSQLTSHGLTTQNLTSPHESPCFNLTSPSHTTDPLNNIGHWHQGTNSLRLILCARSDFRARRCIPSDSNSNDSPTGPTNIDSLSALQYEEYLRAEGAIIHFSIIHRKFSNEIDLPMRYERYVLVWEARPPFRIVAVSRYPVVFGRERVRPWRYEEDILDEDFARAVRRRDSDSGAEANENEDEKAHEESQFYFTYTPSIAWSHRAKDEDEQVHREWGHEDLGTGYLGDEVVVGIGMDDVAMGFARVEVGELLGCLRACDGV